MEVLVCEGCQWPTSQPLLSPQLSHKDNLWAYGISKSLSKQGLDGEELSWCPSWSNILWQGWSCGLVLCPAGNATDPIWRVLASTIGISSWTPLKPQHSNPTPKPLANQVWCFDILTPLTPLIIPQQTLCLPWISYATQKLMLDSCIPYVSAAFFFQV